MEAGLGEPSAATLRTAPIGLSLSLGWFSQAPRLSFGEQEVTTWYREGQRAAAALPEFTMFSWIEKVVPQPPETPKNSGSRAEEQEEQATPAEEAEEGKPATPSKASDARDEAVVKAATEAAQSKTFGAGQSTEPDSGKSAAGGVLTWLAQGLGKVVPQPLDSPTLSRANHEGGDDTTDQKEKDLVAEAKKAGNVSSQGQGSSSSDSAAVGVLSWIAQGLEKVVPQPTWSPTQGRAHGTPEEEAAHKGKETKVIEGPPLPDPSPVPPPAPTPPAASVQLLSTPAAESSSMVATATDKGAGAGVLSWLMQGLDKVMPRPDMEALKKVEEVKVEYSPEAAARRFSEKDTKSSRAEEKRVLDWITQGLEKVIPQPVTKQMAQEVDSVTQCQVEERGKGV